MLPLSCVHLHIELKCAVIKRDGSTSGRTSAFYSVSCMLHHLHAGATLWPKWLFIVKSESRSCAVLNESSNVLFVPFQESVKMEPYIYN
jgi:hypothetical protein